MRIGNKLFPYPILNRNKANSTYLLSSDFQLSVEKDENGNLFTKKDKLILRDARFELNNKKLEQLYKDGKIGCYLIVECSASLYREKFELTMNPNTIEIPLANFNGRVIVSAFLYAKEDFNDYTNETFDEDFANYKFSIEKYCILAADDGFSFISKIDPMEDKQKSSIFTLLRDTTNTQVRYISKPNKILIYIPSRYYDVYTLLRNTPNSLNILYSMLAIPALAGALREIQEGLNDGRFSDLQDVMEQRKWFVSVYNSYKKETGEKLERSVLEDKGPYELAQIVLNNAVCKGMEDLRGLCFSKDDQGDDE